GHPAGDEQPPTTRSSTRRRKIGFLNRIVCLLTIFPTGRDCYDARCGPLNPANSSLLPLEPELEPLQRYKVVLRQDPGVNADLLQPVNAQVDLVLHPVIEIPVETEGERVGVIVERGHKLRREIIGKVCARSLGLDPVITESHFQSAPSRS